MNIHIREYTSDDANAVMQIWNQVVDDGVAFPQEEDLTEDTADVFFKQQTYTGVAQDQESGFHMPDGAYEDIILFYHKI